jgi:hypothetical protein
MKMRTPRDLSDEDLDRLLAADQQFAAALELAEPFLEEGYLEAARQIANDLAIRIVEGRYRPESVAQVRALRPSLHRAGLGYLLDRWRTHTIRGRELAGHTRSLFTRQVEAWINFLWDEPDLDPLLDSAIEATDDLVAWLRQKAGTYHGLAEVFDDEKQEDSA